VEQSCSKVIIINAGEIIAVDSVANLHHRRKGGEMVAIQVKGAPEGEVRQKLEQVRGVAKVTGRDAPEGMVGFEIESMEQYAVRPDLARAIVQSGWDLTELRTVGESLEEIFLELTKSEVKPAPTTTGVTQ
jgi:ABC-2 type transport system ATP-binding protein